MTKVYTSAVVLIPPKNIWATIQKIREKYDRNYRRWMPHITLLYPFRPESEFNSLKLGFEEVCKNIKPFKVKLKRFNFFSHKQQRFTIWLKPIPQNLIIVLQNKIQLITPGCNDVSLFKGGFTPHLSVGQITGQDLLNKVLHNLESNWKPLQFLVDKIFMIAREKSKNSVFQIKRIISLSK